MIKVFTTDRSPDTAGNHLTEQFTDWRNNFTRGIEVISMHTTCNKFGFMLTINYKPL